MKILNSVQDSYAILGINLDQSTQHRPFNFKTLLVTFAFGTAFTLSYVSVFLAHTFKEYTDCIHMGLALTLGSSMFGIIFCKSTKISALIGNFERIITDRESYPTSKAIFNETNGLTEKWTKTVNSCLKVASTWVLLPNLIVNIYIYFKTNSENEGFGLPFPMWFPFDTENWIGYSFVFIYQYAMFTCLFLTVSCVVTLGIGGFIFGLAICGDIKNFLSSIKSSGYTSKKKSEITKQLIEYIKYHSEVKQLIDNFSDILQPVFIVVFLWSTITICSGMLLIQSELKNTVMVIFLISDLIWSFGAVCLCCELCQRTLDSFEDINDEFSQLDWYLYPIEIQKVILQSETNIHEMPVFQCFGSITCERVVLKQVVKKGFSFYTVLRRFGK